MTQVNVHEAKTQLSALIARVLDGEQITIARAGKPVVDLIPHERTTIVYGLGRDEPEHDPALFDGTDPEIQEMFYGPDWAEGSTR
ncbi:type II toxin-antitoxin system Phd/YefM family antitoxin [Microbacterium sp. NPDC056052]|uniref:type II toxin-antitoxin system Phd/YefM family antitoxin n=1 Tax=Microbacterium sp. NPDC056052 TaxID=3345695 RepID=UPI0035E04776